MSDRLKTIIGLWPHGHDDSFDIPHNLAERLVVQRPNVGNEFVEADE
jgi:hypothetical protein